MTHVPHTNPDSPFLLLCVAVAAAGFATGYLLAWSLDLAWQYLNHLADAYIAGLSLYSVPEVWR